MTCYKPAGYGYLVDEWVYKTDKKTGIRDTKPTFQRKLYFDNQVFWKNVKKQGYLDEQLKKGYLFPVPCGKCIGCILEKANQWSTRAVMESKQWENNCFVTLTYDNEHLPKNRSLRKRDYQLFLKRLRKHETGIEEIEKLNKKTGELTKEKPIKYFIAGEYGPATRRPHYHIALFNWKPDDLVFHSWNNNKQPLFTSKKLEKYWGNGFIIVGNLTYESACYIARYTMKKWGKPFNDNIRKNLLNDLEKKYYDKMRELEDYYIDNYDKIDMFEMVENDKKMNKIKQKIESIKKNLKQPEFIEVSRNGGISLRYWENHKEKIKKDMGIMVPTQTGAKLKKIPEYIKGKWRKEDIFEYTAKIIEHGNKMREEANKIMERTSLNRTEYLRKQYEKKLMQIKALQRTAI